MNETFNKNRLQGINKKTKEKTKIGPLNDCQSEAKTAEKKKKKTRNENQLKRKGKGNKHNLRETK